MRESSVSVQTQYGTIKGIHRENCSIFYGIPYAAPPVGELRWRAPQKPAPWKGVCDCTQCTVIPWQPHGWVGERALLENTQSEDCLYLHIWTPDCRAGADLPVYVWIHGGGFMGGCAHEALYDGSALAAQGIVAVSVAYRLGIFGFLAHPELSEENPQKVSGNYGILDQIAALKWVRENIAAFGGNPDQVTVGGQSAGGMSVAVLLTSPLTEGLFGAAVIQSGGPAPGRSVSLSEAEERGKRIQEMTGAKSADEMRAMPPEVLVNLAPDETAQLPFTPCADGSVLPLDPYEAFVSGKIHGVPILTGTNRDEHLFGGEKSDRENLSEVLDRLGEKQRQPQYRYFFTKRSLAKNGTLVGAVHSMELFYVFGTLSCRETNLTPDGEDLGIPSTEEDRELSEKMNRFWGNFIRTGAPGDGWENFFDGGDYRIF